MSFDRLDAEEERARHLAVGRTASDLERDLQLLYRQCAEGGLVRGRGLSARQPELCPRPFCESARAEPFEDRERVAQMLAGGPAPPAAS